MTKDPSLISGYDLAILTPKCVWYEKVASEEIFAMTLLVN